MWCFLKAPKSRAGIHRAFWSAVVPPSVRTQSGAIGLPKTADFVRDSLAHRCKGTRVRGVVQVLHVEGIRIATDALNGLDAERAKAISAIGAQLRHRSQ